MFLVMVVLVQHNASCSFMKLAGIQNPKIILLLLMTSLANVTGFYCLLKILHAVSQHQAKLLLQT